MRKSQTYKLDPVDREESERLVGDRKQYKAEKYRFCNLILYFFMSAFCDLQFFCFSMLTAQLSQIYKISLSLEHWYTPAFLYTSILFAIPAGMIASKLSSTATLGIAVGLTLIGSWIKVCINSSFYFSVAGQYVVGIAYPLFRVNVTKMSTQWFTTPTRPQATTCLALSSSCITMASMFLTTLAIDVDQIPENKHQNYRDRLFVFTLIFACVSTIGGIICLVLYKEKPEKVASRSSTFDRLSLSESCSEFRKNSAGVVIITSLAMAVSVNLSFEGIVESAFRDYVQATFSFKWYAIASIPVCLILIPLFACLSGRYGVFKLFLNIGNFISLVCYAALLGFYSTKNSYLFGTVLVLTTIPYANALWIGIELVSQVLFPIPEPLASAFFLIAVKICTVVILQVSSVFIQTHYFSQMILLYLLIQAISTMLLLIVKDKHKRREIDFEAQEDDAVSEPENKL